MTAVDPFPTATTQPTADVIVATDVVKAFGNQRALDGVSLRIRAGESVGLLGPNGAGKTTLISLLTGLRAPDAGSVTLFGGDPRSPATRTRLGVTPQATAVPETLRVGEIVELVAAHYADPVPTVELLQRFELDALVGKQSGALSGGQKRRLMVALALVGNPQLVVLDEPTTGLDVDGRASLWRELREFRAAGGTLVITSHYLAEIEALAGRVVVVDGGTVIADGTVDVIRQQVNLRRVAFRSTSTPHQLSQLPDVASVEIDDVEAAGDSEPDPRGVLFTLASADADATVRALVSAGLPFTDLQVQAASLEEAFVAMTRHQQSISDQIDADTSTCDSDIKEAS